MKKRITSVILTLSIILTISTSSFAKATLDIDYIKSLTKIIEESYPFEITEDQLTEGALKGIFGSLDPYSNYYNPEEYKKFTENITGEMDEAGIGVRIMEVEGEVVIAELMKGNSAELSGLKVGDTIVSVDDKDIKESSIDDASALIRGVVNTKVKIGIKREDESKILYFNITRKPIVIIPVEWRVIDQKIGYIKISEFNNNAVIQSKYALEELKKKNIKNIVFDIRDNPGGYLTSVIDILQAIIPEGPIVHVKDSKGNLVTYSSFTKQTPYKVVVITNENSASAAEIFAGAVKDRGVGKVVGTKTYGKGTVQNIIPLEKGGAIKLTIAEYFTPKMKKVNGVGIIPDIEIKPIYKEGKDQFLEKALEIFM